MLIKRETREVGGQKLTFEVYKPTGTQDEWGLLANSLGKQFIYYCRTHKQIIPMKIFYPEKESLFRCLQCKAIKTAAAKEEILAFYRRTYKLRYHIMKLKWYPGIRQFKATKQGRVDARRTIVAWAKERGRNGLPPVPPPLYPFPMPKPHLEGEKRKAAMEKYRQKKAAFKAYILRLQEPKTHRSKREKLQQSD